MKSSAYIDLSVASLKMYDVSYIMKVANFVLITGTFYKSST